MCAGGISEPVSLASFIAAPKAVVMALDFGAAAMCTQAWASASSPSGLPRKS